MFLGIEDLIRNDIEEYIREIKTEPVDPDEAKLQDNSSASTEVLPRLKRRISTVDANDGTSKVTRFSVDDAVGRGREPNLLKNQANYQPSTSTAQPAHVSAPNRDPRTRRQVNNGNDTNTSSPSSAVTDAQRRAFLERCLAAEDVVRVSTSSNHLPQQIRDIRSQVSGAKKLINNQSKSFYANVPVGPLMSDSSNQQRSPMISSNHNALFRSQATAENIRDSLVGQRYNNIPPGLQTIAQLVGADLDAISQAMQPPRDENPTETFYMGNTRSFMTQTDFEENAEPSRRKESEVKLENKSVQTEKNNGVFSITIDDLRKLTAEQRKGLEDFKRVCI